MATEDKNNHDDKDTKDSGSNSADSGDNDSGTQNDQDSLRQMVREEVREALAGLNLSGKNDDKTDADKDSKDEPTRTPRRVDVERMAEEAVRKATERFEHEQDHKAIRNGKTKEEKEERKEAAPKTVRRLTRALWGDED